MDIYLKLAIALCVICASNVCFAETDVDHAQNIERKFTELSETFEKLVQELNLQREVNNALISKVISQERVIQGLTSRMKELEDASSKKTNTLLRNGRQERTAIAFSAHLDHELDNLQADQTIPFGSVELNDGGGYNNVTGVFTVPQDGVYMFTFTVEDYHGHRIWCKLVVDGALKASVVEWSNAGQNAQGSNTVFMRLTTGQNVWVAIDTRESGDTLQGWADLRSTTFAGAYMYP